MSECYKMVKVEYIKYKQVPLDKLQFDGASPPNPLPHRGGGISNLYLLRF